MIISIKSSASGGSSRGLVHYLAHSKLDKSKEETEKREFFSDSGNDLDVKRANEYLSVTDSKPKPEELLHLVVAPGKEEIERVGNDLKAQKAALKVLARETVAQLEKEVKAKKLKWVAVAHFNTNNPHTHLAIQKEFVNEKGQIENLHITRQMLYYNEKGENGEKKLSKGALILAAENKLTEIACQRQKTQENNINPKSDKITEKLTNQSENPPQVSVEPIKIPNYRERRILAEEMLVTAEITRRTRNIENLIEHGDKKRFKIKNEETGRTHHLSIFDLERKIEIVSRRKAWVLHPKNPAKRAESMSRFAQEEHTKHLPIINQLETIRRHVLGFENRHLNPAEERHTRLHNQKLLIEKKYERQNAPMPLPIFKPDEIQQLQTEAIREQNVEKILQLENIRQVNAFELKKASRRDKDVQEFLGMKIVAALKLEAAEKRLLNFPNTKDFIKVKIGSSLWSHFSLEQHKNQNAPQNGWLTKIRDKAISLLFDSEKKKNSEEKLDYPALNTQVSAALENVENLRRNEVQKQKEFVETLEQIFQAETNPNKLKLTPNFSAFELAELEDLSFETEREGLYQKSLQWQEKWLVEKLSVGQNESTNEHPPQISDNAELPQNQTNNVKKIVGNFVLGRAEARIILATTKIAKAEENITRYNRHNFFLKHRLTNPKTGLTYELSLRDVEPKEPYYMLDKFLIKVLETKKQKQEREMVQKAAQAKEKELTRDLQIARANLLRLENQKTELLNHYENAQNTNPIFTPKEIALLDSRKYQTTKKTEAERIEKIINQAEKSNRVERMQDLLNQTANELKNLVPDLSDKRKFFSPTQDSATKEQQTTAFQSELSNHNQVYENNEHSSQFRANQKNTDLEKSAVKDRGRDR